MIIRLWSRFWLSYWRGETCRRLESPLSKLMGAYLFSCDDLASCHTGIYRIDTESICEDLAMTAAQVNAALDDCEAAGLIVRDRKSRHVFVVEFSWYQLARTNEGQVAGSGPDIKTSWRECAGLFRTCPSLAIQWYERYRSDLFLDQSPALIREYERAKGIQGESSQFKPVQASSSHQGESSQFNQNQASSSQFNTPLEVRSKKEEVRGEIRAGARETPPASGIDRQVKGDPRWSATVAEDAIRRYCEIVEKSGRYPVGDPDQAFERAALYLRDTMNWPEDDIGPVLLQIVELAAKDDAFRAHPKHGDLFLKVEWLMGSKPGKTAFGVDVRIPEWVNKIKACRPAPRPPPRPVAPLPIPVHQASPEERAEYARILKAGKLLIEAKQREFMGLPPLKPAPEPTQDGAA